MTAHAGYLLTGIGLVMAYVFSVRAAYRYGQSAGLRAAKDILEEVARE